MGWLIIGILLLIFFSGSGTLFCFVFLNESGSIGAWCATGICVVITCIVVCYLCVKELWNIGYPKRYSNFGDNSIDNSFNSQNSLLLGRRWNIN